MIRIAEAAPLERFNATLEPKDLTATLNSIEDASVIDRNVLFRDDLDHFLRDHATHDSRDVV